MKKNQSQKRKKLNRDNPLPKKNSINSHLLELRSRLLWWLLSLFLCTCLGFYFYRTLIKFLITPLNEPLYYTSPVGGLNFAFQVSVIFGFIISLPILVYQIFKFIQPTFSLQIGKAIFFLMFLSVFLLICGLSFSYLVSLPATLHFFNLFNNGQLHPLISSNEYLSFVMQYFIGISILFQLPVVLILINFVLPLKINVLLKYQRHLIVACFVVSAIFTLDPIDQTIMAIPLIILFYLSVVIIYFFNKQAGNL